MTAKQTYEAIKSIMSEIEYAEVKKKKKKKKKKINR